MFIVNQIFDIVNNFTLTYGAEGVIGVGAALLVCIWCISLGYKK